MAYPKTLRQFSRDIAPKISPLQINANAVGKLRRIRTEVGHLMQQLDDALKNIDEQPEQ